MPGHTKCFAPSVRSHSLFTTVLWLLLTEAYLPSWHFSLYEMKGPFPTCIILHFLFAVQSKTVCETFFIINSNKIKLCHYIPSKDVGKDSRLSSGASNFNSHNSWEAPVGLVIFFAPKYNQIFSLYQKMKSHPCL